jgi:exonuclease III
LAEHTHAAAIYKQQKFSDHAPLTVEYGFSL